MSDKNSEQNQQSRPHLQPQQQQPQQQSSHNNPQRKKFESPKREAIVDLSKYKDTQVRVKLMGGRLVVGVLKGHDQLMNLVLDETVEYMKNANDEVSKDKTRELGFTVIRGTILVSISPVEGSEVIYVQTS
ncbi:similar to Saccharomyces cerevisiae YNL147W LSM7 Lsm (Like Sm) protein [Maudiozyma barnettii]|uniref:Similar to Saccharomyces cerevisiae YNL147W LSM7 Lsm (Like Sm) protein n=1 Tax=Maudiozyma barnettii TaxID=61262 RepID=A0A8H2VEN7_9SACH|nr:Sm-like protein LSM7 [Kazachstania barnettii]CAB4254201.1 similar to Saccharomyces cerevisiae YNL147W LSM7 Lsm (Like Sm) protein [Kazachstania barnettii]CAD1781935.1 similar to Saccharomyces cerevisiae YNL147W LSM7 Lsm (Like Sm) protein [Kazachstania barnettii]